MTLKETLRPLKNTRVMDLVADAGMDVTSWSFSKKTGAVQYPASNPAFCYEWAFTDQNMTVVNIWFGQIKEAKGQLSCDLNLRDWSETVRHSELLKPAQRSAGTRRALKMDGALLHAYKKQLPVRVILGEGSRQDIFNPKLLKASQMKLRLLDPEPWFVQQYKFETGDCHLVRSVQDRFVDQFSIGHENVPVKQHEVVGKVWERSPAVRASVLARAKGICEFCEEPGFITAAGLVYLETHHIVCLSEGGADHQINVVALCPNDHRKGSSWNEPKRDADKNACDGQNARPTISPGQTLKAFGHHMRAEVG